MNPIASYKPSKNLNHCYAAPTTMAERELSSFFNAVIQLFGKEQAELSAEDWLRELTEIDALPVSARAWRSITARASAQLANRVNAKPLSPELSNA
jgi:hypothetical protein